MKTLRIAVLAGALLALGGGAALLAAWDIPAPSAEVERIIPNDRFPR